MKPEMKMCTSLPIYILTTIFVFGCVSAMPSVVFRQDPRIQPSVHEQDTVALHSVPEQDPGILHNKLEQDSGTMEIIEEILGKPCPNDWTRFNNYCYLVSTTIMSRDDAQKNCESLGAELVKINSAEEKDFVLDLSKQEPSVTLVWIGLKWYTGKDFYWSDSSVPDYTNWAPGEPNGEDREPCVLMYTGQKKKNLPTAAAGYWNDVKCDGVPSIGSVCKRLP